MAAAQLTWALFRLLVCILLQRFAGGQKEYPQQGDRSCMNQHESEKESQSLRKTLDEETRKLLNSCTIPRIEWRGIGSSQPWNLPLSDEPYVVQSPHGWNREIAQSLERNALLHSMGNVTCTPSQGGSKRIGHFEMTLAEYLTEWLPRPISRNAEENRYVFGEFGEQWAPLRKTYVLPPCEVCSHDAAAVTIGLGGKYSGAPWHFHNSAFVEVFDGAKYFAFLPPGDPVIEEIEKVMQFNASMSQFHWHLEERPILENKGRLRNMQECVINPGEILYFPDNWHHGVINLGEYTAFVSSFINKDLAKDKSVKTRRPGATNNFLKLLLP